MIDGSTVTADLLTGALSDTTSVNTNLLLTMSQPFSNTLMDGVSDASLADTSMLLADTGAVIAPSVTATSPSPREPPRGPLAGQLPSAGPESVGETTPTSVVNVAPWDKHIISPKSPRSELPGEDVVSGQPIKDNLSSSVLANTAAVTTQPFIDVTDGRNESKNLQPTSPSMDSLQPASITSKGKR